MLNISTKTLFISCLVVISTSLTVAQPKDNSPFSQFGLGDYFDTDLPSSHAMGGLGSIYHDFFEANLDNPASLGFLQYTTFQVGFFTKRSNFNRIGQKQNVWSGNLDHLSLNIPIINPLNEALERRETAFSWGTSISLRPYSQVGYHVRIEDEIDSIGTVERNFKGSGGLYQFNLGNGIKYKNLSAGINLTYLYGKQSFDEQTQFLELTNIFTDIFQTTVSYKGFKYRLGAIYEHPLDLKDARESGDKPSQLLSAGFFYEGKSNFDTNSDNLKLAYNELTSELDTAFIALDSDAKGKMGGMWGGGIMYRRAGDFRVGVDYQVSTASDYENEARPYAMKDTWRLGFGAAWIPDANSITSYFRRVEYRAGFYTKTDPRVIEGEQVKEGAFTFGAALPLILQRNIAFVQVGFDIGKRTGGERLSDNFVRGKIGLVFNDNAWFIKGKYN